jgi:hypothetical protein
MTYGKMPGAHDEGIRNNPPVRSKFDKSQGKGLPAPHLKHPGEIAKDTGTRMPGHNENGHKLPAERSVGLGASHLRTHYGPGEMGSPMVHSTGQGKPKNERLTDGNVIKSSTRYFAPQMDSHEPDPVRARDGDRHAKQHATGKGQESGKSSRPQHQDNHSSRSKEPHATLDRSKMKS